MRFELHPFAEIIPEASPEDFKALVESSSLSASLSRSAPGRVA